MKLYDELAKLSAVVILSLLVFLWCGAPAQAVTGEVLGIHILNPGEISLAADFLKQNDSQKDVWQYVTVPFTVADLQKPDEWQTAFDIAREKKIIPIVRLTSEFKNGAWTVPTRKQIMDQLQFLSVRTWPTEDRHIIFFNEPNHAKEWGGKLDPEEYADVLEFGARGARATNPHFKVLPAGLDLAAPNGSVTMDSTTYLNRMLAHKPEVFSHIDYWNSHSYPNPAFSSSPQKTGKNSLRGFQVELAYLKEKTGKDFQVFITETGWAENNATRRWLSSYYQYASQHIWSDERVIAVTPFVLRGAPGPFAEFSMIDALGKMTNQSVQLQKVLGNL